MMAKKDENKKAEAENVEQVSAEVAKTAEKALDGEKVKCVALLIKLRSTHPHESYGRCGYRFNKETAVRIPIAEMPEEAVAVFDSDPYLECEYECA